MLTPKISEGSNVKKRYTIIDTALLARVLSTITDLPSIADIKAKAERIKRASAFARKLNSEEFTHAELATLFLDLLNGPKTQIRRAKKLKADDKSNLVKEVTFSKYFIETVLPVLLKYFPGDQQELLGNLVKNNIPPAAPLAFNGRANQLVELLKRGRYNNQVICRTKPTLAKWICTYFTCQTLRGNESPNEDTVNEILKNNEKEGVQKNHILVDVLTYQEPASRKK